MDLTTIREELQRYLSLVTFPTWLQLGWPPSVKQILAISGATIATLGLSAYVYIKIFCDWLWDDIKMARGISAFVKTIGALNAFYDPAARLEKQAVDIPNKPFLLFEDQKYTFAETNARANQIANALSRLGITREQRLAILMKNKPELLFIYYACLKCAIPISFLNTNLRTKALIHCVRDGATKNLIVDDDPELLAAVVEISEDLKSDGVRVLSYGSNEGHENLLNTIEKCDNSQQEFPARRELSTYDVALFIFTSGTTGLPKAAKVTYYRLGRGSAFFYVFGVGPDDVVYSPLPLYHSAALLTFAGSALLIGCPFSFARKFSASRFWDDCDKHGATVVQYIGETCRYLLSRPPLESDSKHNVRMAIGNGLRRDIWTEFKTRFNIERIGEFYAATEGNVFFGNMRNKTGSCGRKSPLSNMSKQVPKSLFIQYDTESDEVIRGTDGLCVQVPRGTPGLVVAEINDTGRFDGYTNSKQTNSKLIRNVLKKGDVYFNTGDMMLWDKDYHVYFVDRIGDTFRWKGENVSTLEVGNLIGEIAMIEDCSVYGVPIQGTDGKCGMAAIVLHADVEVTAEALKSIYKHCEQFLPAYARPVFIRFMSELYVTGTYKHLKFKLQQEGFDCNKVSDVYVHDLKLGTYVPLTPDVYESIINGRMKV